MNTANCVGWRFAISIASVLFALCVRAQDFSLPILKSTGAHGVVSIEADPASTDKQGAFKVVALNTGSTVAALSLTDITVETSKGWRVPLLTADQLIEAARKDAKTITQANAHQQSNFARPEMQRSATGQLDVSNFAGANDSVGGAVSQRSKVPDAQTQNAELETRVAQIKTAVLSSLEVPPGQIAGAQVITGRAKFARKEAKRMYVRVRFNGDEHQLSFDLPQAQ